MNRSAKIKSIRIDEELSRKLKQWMYWIAIAVFLQSATHAQELCLPLNTNTVVKGIVEFPDVTTKSHIKSNTLANTIVLILPGSHTKNRDGRDEANPQTGIGVYAGLAMALREQGLAVARLDSPLCTIEPIANQRACDGDLVEGEMDESLATQKQAYLITAQLLKNRYPNYRVVMMGHSQGAILAAQLLSQHGRIADALFTYGMSTRAMRDATRFALGNSRLVAMQILIRQYGKTCVDNQAIQNSDQVGYLLSMRAPIEKWLAPQGQWCEDKIELSYS